MFPRRRNKLSDFSSFETFVVNDNEHLHRKTFTFKCSAVWKIRKHPSERMNTIFLLC